MLTGKKVFSGDDAMAVIEKHVSEPIPQLSGELEVYQALLAMLLAKDPDKRCQNAAELLQAIGRDFGGRAEISPELALAAA